MLPERAAESICIMFAGRIAERRALKPDADGWQRFFPSDDARVAHHEAAHAVLAGLVFRWHVSVATIAPEVEMVEGEPIVRTLGHVAHSPEGTEPVDTSNRTGTMTDLTKVAAIALMWAEPKTWQAALRTIRALRAETIRLVDSHWPVIQVVAGQLQKHRTLDAGQFVAIIAGASPSRVLKIETCEDIAA